MKHVVIIEPELKQYRRRLFVDLAERLRRDDIQLTVAFSDPVGAAAERHDTVVLDASIAMKVRALRLFGDRADLQLAFAATRRADLVICDQANRHLFNYWMIALSRLGRKRVAFWGHGYNHQARHPGLSEWLKRRLLDTVDGWFAYTDEVARYLVAHDVPRDKITVIHNTIDTDELEHALAACSPEPRGPGHVALYCGALTREKELDFLLAAAQKIHAEVASFELVIVGDGPERSRVEAAARDVPYIRYEGARFGAARATYFASADVFVMPTLVGLSIVDAFVAGLPMLTTDLPTHGPEIEYLRPGENGIRCPHDVEAFAAATSSLLRDSHRLERLRAGARASGAKLGHDRMVDAFAHGIHRCLARD